MVDDIFLTAKQVRSRYGNVSEMTLWRWVHDAKLNFPAPEKIRARNFWRLSALDAWDKQRVAA